MLNRLILIGFLFALAVLAVVSGGISLPGESIQLLWLVLGGVVGWFLAWFDYIAYAYILHPEAQVSQYIQFQINNRRFKKVVEMIQLRGSEFDRLTTKSALFQLAWVVLTIFTLTSTAGWFGKTMIMSLGLRMLIEQWQLYLKNKEALKKELFWQIARPVSDKELRWYLYIFSGLFLWFVLILV